MPAHDILIRRDVRRHRFSETALRRAASRILTALGWKEASLSLWLVGDSRMRTLNRRYFGHDCPTDVIAFSQLEGRRLMVPGNQKTFLGDIIISLDTTERQAAEYDQDFMYEFFFYVCHGILHLMGHDDSTPKLRKRMHERQHAILKKIRIKNSMRS